jgi:hypothetical protein
MFSSNRSNSAERERSLRHIVANAYTWLWDFFWLPIRLFAKLLLQTKLFPAKWKPWLFGAGLGRWPEKINDEHYTLCRNPDCEICRSLLPRELDIDHEREITHDPFDILSTLRRKSKS